MAMLTVHAQKNRAAKGVYVEFGGRMSRHVTVISSPWMRTEHAKKNTDIGAN